MRSTTVQLIPVAVIRFFFIKINSVYRVFFLSTFYPRSQCNEITYIIFNIRIHNLFCFSCLLAWYSSILLNTSSEVPSPKSVIVQFNKLFGFVYSNFWRRPKPPRLPMLRLRVKYGTTLSPCLLHAKACTFHMNLRKERKKEEHNKKETRQ